MFSQIISKHKKSFALSCSILDCFILGLRPTGSAPLPEANVTEQNSGTGSGYSRGRGRGYGRGYGRGRGYNQIRGRGVSFKNSYSHQK